MKRQFVDQAAPIYGEPHPTKRKVIHRLHHTQPIQNIVEPVSAEHDLTGQSKEFFDQQLKRAIAIVCRGNGYDSARPEALEKFRGLVDAFMRNFLAQVRKSMSSARRTSTVAHDWVYALNAVGVPGSSALDEHLATGNLPPSLLQPAFAPPEPAEAPPADLEGLLGPEMSGRADKESRRYIPQHFPPFPPKHAWKSTPVFTERENDPRKIREKATEEGILAEQSLRKLMAAQKQGLQGDKARKQRRSTRMKESDKLWQEAMKDVIAEEEDRAEKAAKQVEDGMDEDEEDYFNNNIEEAQPRPERKRNLQEGVHVNYDQKYWRQSARGF